MIYNRKIEYALIALKHMAQKEDKELISVREICDQYNTPFDTTSKVLQTLANYHIVKSHQGTKGGYELIKSLKDVSYSELAHLIEGPIFELKCHSLNEECKLHDNCNIVLPMHKLGSYMNHILKNLSVFDLLFTPLNQIKKMKVSL